MLTKSLRDATNGLATIGTLVLEWTHLSDLTGNDLYANLTQHAESYLLNPQPQSSQPFPGLLGTNVEIATGNFLDSAGGWIGGDDSFYEYLIKMYVYDSSSFGTYKDRWVAAADSSIQYLASNPSSRPDLTFLAQFDGTQLIYESEHRKQNQFIYFFNTIISHYYSCLLCWWKFHPWRPRPRKTEVH